MSKGITIHLILVPKTELKHTYSSIIESTFVEKTDQYDFNLKAFAILPDHIHLLITDENFVQEDNSSAYNQTDCIFEIVETISQRVSDIFEERLEWEDYVHVMLMPLGHSEILSSYIKDQQNIHDRMTLKEEIEVVFEQKAIFPDRENGFEGYRYN